MCNFIKKNQVYHPDWKPADPWWFIINQSYCQILIRFDESSLLSHVLLFGRCLVKWNSVHFRQILSKSFWKADLNWMFSHSLESRVISWFSNRVANLKKVLLHFRWTIKNFWRCPWCNGYCRRKWTRRHEFKSWTRLIPFHIALIPLGKVWIQLFSLQLWVNSRTDWVLQPWWGN